LKNVVDEVAMADQVDQADVRRVELDRADEKAPLG
jgi:hypothetical protein